MCASYNTQRRGSVFLHPFLQQHLSAQEAVRTQTPNTEDSAASPTTPMTASPRESVPQDMAHQPRVHRRHPSQTGSVMSEPEEK